MKIARIMRGNGIVRQYDRIKEETIVKGTCAAGMFAVGAMSASRHRLFTTLISAFMSCMYVKELEICLNKMLELRPKILEIKARAKAIKKAGKH